MMFINVNEYNKLEQASLGFQFLRNLKEFREANLNSLNEYVEWVHQWRAYEKEFVAAIRHFRVLKNKAESSEQKEWYWYQKCSYKPVVRKMYEARAEQKEKFKNSDFFESGSINKNKS